MRIPALLGLAALSALGAAGCPTEPPPPPGPATGPLGIVIEADGRTWAGAAALDITPTIQETYTDLDADDEFDGCLDDPTATVEGCDEPFDDVNGNGWFDATFIGGFGPLRPAVDVHDPITARALVLSEGGDYVAFVTLDIVGLGSPRIHAARDLLVADGFDGDRLIATSSHNHQGPDTMGLWGDPYDFADPVTGLDPAYQERVSQAIAQAVRDAAAAMEPVQVRIGSKRMRDHDPYLSAPRFGGRNISPRMHGMINDIRDPLIVSDQLLTLQGRREDGSTVFTLTSWAGHPEVRDSNNSSLSADWVGVERNALEARYGGTALHLAECLGGMQSALGGDLPRVLPDGTHVYQECDADAVADDTDAGCFGKAAGDRRTDESGDDVPAWAERSSWEFVTSHGWLIADAAIDVLENDAEEISLTPMRIEVESLWVAIENLAYQVLGPSGIFDLGLEDAIASPALCPEAAAGTAPGCIETRTFRLRLGPLGLITAPGELLPELAWGLPTDDPLWVTERDDPAARGPDSRYFPQHDADCDALTWADCKDAGSVGDCDCLSLHAWPYTISYDPTVPPLLDLLDPAETPYRAIVGMADNYLSYIIPEPDFNTSVSLLSDNDGDHYEDTVSPASAFATRLQAAQLEIADRW